MIPSPRQAAVIDFVANGRGSAFVEAVAGAGKTTTLIQALAKTNGYVSFAAYNKKIADEIQAKVAKLNLGNRVRIATFHSFGFNAWRRAYPQVKRANGHEKTDQMVEALKIDKPLQGFVPKLISLAKQGCAGLLWNIDDDSHWYQIIDHFDLAFELEDQELIAKGVAFAKAGLRWHRDRASELIDFDDMIYMPVVTNTRFFQVDWVFVDEAQDTNPARRAMARKMLKPNGRAVFVGDRHQAIYGFTGADNDAIDQIIRDFNCTTLPLTVTYRCPKSVVSEARQIVSHIEAHETAPDGVVNNTQEREFVKRTDLTAADAILCRNTKPLVQMAYTLIRRGIACHVEGRDIGMGLLKLVNKFESRTLDGFIDKLTEYGEQQSQKLIAKGRETQAEALMDRVETILIIAEGCKDADCVRNKIVELFQDSEHERKPTLTLSTVHKSKGREWQRVFILGREAFMPSPYARQAWQQEQEMNLIYVAVTRAQGELVYVSMEPKQ